MYYILHKPYGTDEPWIELPNGTRSKKEAREIAKTLHAQVKEDGSRQVNIKICVGKGRDRRELLRQ